MSCDLLLNNCFLLQTAAAYVLFYRRRTEGKPVRRNILDRSLSQSFAEEHKKLKEKYATLDEEDEEKEKDDATKVDGTELNASTESRNEVNTVYSPCVSVCPLKSIQTFTLSHSLCPVCSRQQVRTCLPTPTSRSQTKREETLIILLF